MHSRFPAVSTLLAFALIATAAGAQSAPRGAPDFLLTGGKVFTADSAHPWAEAVAIRGERVVAVGTTAELRRLAGRGTREIALGGRVVIPGINDAHDHIVDVVPGVAFQTSASPTPDDSFTVVRDSLRALVARVPRGTLLEANIGQRALEDPRARRAALDSIAPDHPVLLRAWWGHGMVLNTVALHSVGIGETARDPSGGWFERDSAGRLTGRLDEYAQWDAYRRILSRATQAALVAGLRAYGDSALAVGVTTVQNMASNQSPAVAIPAFRAANLPMRVRLIRWSIPDSLGRNEREWDTVRANVAPRVVVSGRKWVLDATPFEGFALRRTPYPGRPGWYGRLDFPLDTIRAMLAGALRPGAAQLHLHVVGDSTMLLVLDAMESLAPDSVWRAKRLRIEHGPGIVGPAIARARRLGIVIAQPRFDTANPLRSWVAAGIPVAYGSDALRNPFLHMMWAVTKPARPSEAISREDAVTIFTHGSAYAERAEREKGMLAPGMLADLAVLSQDIFTVPVQALPATTSVLTIVGGRVARDVLTPAPAPAGASTPRATLDFDADWHFHLGDVSGGENPTLEDSGWRVLDLPHDWSIEGDFSATNPAGAGGGALPGGIGWYRKTFTVPAADSARETFVDFDGVYRDSEVWINGHSVGKRPYGYSSFRYELTPYLHYGATPNVIAVRVDNSQQPNSRWYSGSGIYRNVRLVTTSRVHVDQWGTYVTTPGVSAQSARVQLRTTLRNGSASDRPVTLTTTLYDAAGRAVASSSSNVTVPHDSVADATQELILRAPARWSIEKPVMYRAETRVKCGTSVCDEYTTPFGIRSFEFRADSGFFLNGQHLKIRGVCLHHDLGALGSAVNVRAIQRQLQLMKDMGVNAIRTSHNPPAPELLDLADHMGFVIMDEAFDMWRKPKTTYDYSKDFPAWHERDLADMVRRDRNHPSVFIWSIGNEVMEQWQDGDSTAAPIARELAGIIRRLDTTRPITAAANNGSSANPLFTSGALDLLGHNYHHEKWADFPTQFPGQKYIITEAMSAYNSRGYYEQPSDSVAVYFTPYDTTQGQKPNANYRISSYDNRRASWGSLHETSLRIFEAHPFLSGMFVWQGIDYIGEPTPYQWPARSSYFGLVDLAGFPKDPYWLYQSVWTTKPMLHLFPHWNWKQGDTVDVWAYTNAGDEVELFLDGRSLGRKTKGGAASHVWWRVAYAPGTLRAEARRGGKVTLAETVKTTGPAVRVKLTPDRSTLRADGKDLSFVTVTVVDSTGAPVPDAEPVVHLTLTGGATIAGVDNGDQVNHERFQRDSVQLYAGKALVIVRPGKRPGAATVTATAGGLKAGTARLTMR